MAAFSKLNLPAHPSRVVEKMGIQMRLMQDSDILYIWKLLEKSKWNNISWPVWIFYQNVPSFRQWVTVDEKDRPLSYISASQHFWGLFVCELPFSVESKLDLNFWPIPLAEMDENIGVRSAIDFTSNRIMGGVDLPYTSPIGTIKFQGRVTFLDTLKTLPKGLFNPQFKVYPVQDDRTIERIVKYDQKTVMESKSTQARRDFLWAWLRMGRCTRWDPAPKIMSLYAENESGMVVGYGSLCPAANEKATIIGPLYADNQEMARTLMTELLKLYNSTVIPIDQLILDVPDEKKEFIEFLSDIGMVVSLSMKPVFSRYVPNLVYERVYCCASTMCQLY